MYKYLEPHFSKLFVKFILKKKKYSHKGIFLILTDIPAILQNSNPTESHPT